MDFIERTKEEWQRRGSLGVLLEKLRKHAPSFLDAPLDYLSACLPYYIGGQRFFLWSDIPLDREKSFVSFLKYKREEIDVFADLGGYRGLFSVLASKICDSKKVYCFEMDPENVDIIRSTLERNGRGENVEVVEKAIWSESNTLKAKTGEKHRSRISDNDEEEVKAISLDGFFDNRESPDAIKIDIEGAELHALRGAQHIIEEEKPYILLELHKGSMIRQFSHAPSDVIQLLKELGYVVKSATKDDHFIAYPEKREENRG